MLRSLEKSLSFFCSSLLKRLMVCSSLDPALIGWTPLLGEGLDLLFVEISQSIRLKICCERSLFVAHNPAGNNETVLRIELGECLDLLHHLGTKRCIRNLVQTIKKEED